MMARKTLISVNQFLVPPTTPFLPTQFTMPLYIMLQFIMPQSIMPQFIMLLP